MQRAAGQTQRSATELAVEEMDLLVNDWFAQVLPAPPAGAEMLSTRGRLALLLADMPGQWQDQFLRPAPWPAEFAARMREAYLRAGPDFQLAKMTPRPLDLGPITTLTHLSHLPYFKMAASWALFGLLLVLLFYLASPLWLFFLLTFNRMLWYEAHTGLSRITVRPLTPFLKVNATQHALLIFAICMATLFLPKVLALLDLARDAPRRRAFGGLVHATFSALLETAFSTLHAPLQMLWHSQFVAASLLLLGVHWGPQKRTAEGTAWSQAIRRHAGHSALGWIWGTAIWRLDHPAFWWFAPVVAGMALSIPLSVLTSRPSLGQNARRLGLFVTPEEMALPPELAALRARMAALQEAGQTAPRPADSGLADAVLDPYVNAIHVSLLREKGQNPAYAQALAALGAGRPEVRSLGEKLLAEGPEHVSPAEKLLILSDAEALPWLHRQAWLRPGGTLARWWQEQIRGYAR